MYLVEENRHWMVQLALEVSEVYYSIMVAASAIMISQFLMGFFSVPEK